MKNQTSFKPGNKLGVDRPQPGQGKKKTTTQSANEAISKNRDRIPEFLDELHEIYTNTGLSQRDRMEARKLWVKTMENVVKILEKTTPGKVEISDTQIVAIAKAAQESYRELTKLKSDSL